MWVFPHHDMNHAILLHCKQNTCTVYFIKYSKNRFPTKFEFPSPLQLHALILLSTDRHKYFCLQCLTSQLPLDRHFYSTLDRHDFRFTPTMSSIGCVVINWNNPFSIPVQLCYRALQTLPICPYL